jgi:GT2 family glycosyltransferase
MKPLVSVVISTWNRVELLQGAIESVVKQDYPNIELIVVDNASDDGTLEFMQSMLDDQDGVRYDIEGHHPNFIFRNITNVDYTRLPYPDPSAMKTLNMGFKRANGKYILVLDDDAVMNEVNCLSELVEDMELHPNLGLICPNIVGTDRKTQLLEYRDYPELYLGHGRMYAYCGACALMRADVFEDLGFYDESFILYWNEADINVRMLYGGWDVAYNNFVVATHFVSQKQRFMRKSLYYHLRNGNMVLNRTLSFRNRLHLIPIRILNLLYVIHTDFEFNLWYVLKIYGLALHSFMNIFGMMGRYKPHNSKIFKEVNDHYMKVHMDENKKWTWTYWKPHVKDFIYYKIIGDFHGS